MEAGRELLLAAVRAGARSVQVAYSRDEDGRFELSTTDDGSGADGRWTTEPREAGRRMDILLLREMAHSAGGDLEAEGGPGRGTTVRLHVPDRPPAL